MKDFLLLLKAMKANSATMVKKRDGSIRVRRSTLLPTLLTGILFALVFGFSSINDCLSLLAVGVEQSLVGDYFAFSLAFYLLYTFFIDCAHIVNNFFLNDDVVFLPLPIKAGKLFLARFLLSFVYSFSSTFFCLAAMLVGYAVLISLEISLVFLLFFLALFLTIGLFAFAFLFVNLLYRLIGQRRTRKKNIAFSLTFSLLSILPLLVPMFFPLDVSSLSAAQKSLASCQSLLPFVFWLSFFPTALFFPSSLTWLWTLLAFLIPVLVFVLDYLFGSRLYLSNRVFGKERTRKKKEKKDALWKELLFREKHPLLFLLKRELSNYRGHYGLFVSAISTSLMVVLSMVVTLTSLSDGDTLSSLSPSLFLLSFHATLFFSSYQPVFSFASFSLEGPGIQIIQTSPLRRGPYLLVKLVPGTILSFLLSFSLLLGYGFAYSLDPLSFVFSALALLSYTLVSNLVSLILGIRFCQFSFDNATEIVRRGIGPTLSSLILFFLPIVPLAVETPLLLLLPSLLFLAPLLVFVLFALLSVLLFFLAGKTLKKKLASQLFL